MERERTLVKDLQETQGKLGDHLASGVREAPVKPGLHQDGGQGF